MLYFFLSLISGGRDLASLVSCLHIILVRLITNSGFYQTLPMVFFIISLLFLNRLNLDNNSSSNYQTLEEENLLVFKDSCVYRPSLDHRRQNYPFLFDFPATPSFVILFLKYIFFFTFFPVLKRPYSLPFYSRK